MNIFGPKFCVCDLETKNRLAPPSDFIGSGVSQSKDDKNILAPCFRKIALSRSFGSLSKARVGSGQEKKKLGGLSRYSIRWEKFFMQKYISHTNLWNAQNMANSGDFSPESHGQKIMTLFDDDFLYRRFAQGTERYDGVSVW